VWIFVACVGLAGSAFAQVSRAWVSGAGDDLNPCTRAAPCKSLSGAYAKVAAGGEIDVLDPGGYGGLAINKPITISGVGTHGGVLVTATDGITINILAPPAGSATATVVLRNLQIDGLGDAGSSPGLNGVHVLSSIPTEVILDNVNVHAFSLNGVLAEGANRVAINGGTFTSNAGVAIHAVDSSAIYVANSQIVRNNIAVQADLGSTIRLSNNDVFDNKTGFACGTGGTLASAANNRKANNVGGSVPACSPTVAITIQ